jgi:hypothetical protein
MKTYAVLLAALIAAPAFGECETVAWGERPVVPNGSRATATEMLAARDAVVSYVSAGQAYLACNQPSPLASELVLDRLERVALDFNRQRARFLDRQSEIAAH